MIDHTAFLASVPVETRDALTRRSDRKGLPHAAGHFSLIVFLAVWVASAGPGWPLALPALGVALAFLFTLQHECTHQTPFRSRWLNEAAGHLTGLLLIQPFHWFRAFHMAHHRFTNDPDRDPELVAPKPKTHRAILWHVIGLGLWRAKLETLCQNAFGALAVPYLAPRSHTRVRRDARVMLAIYAVAVLLLGPLLFWIWLLPLALGLPVLRLYLLAEHGLCPPVANIFENTRTTFTNRSVRWLSWNMPFHAEHHAWPQVPFHALPALHDLAKPYLRSTSASYGTFTCDYVQATRARVTPP